MDCLPSQMDKGSLLVPVPVKRNREPEPSEAFQMGSPFDLLLF